MDTKTQKMLDKLENVIIFVPTNFRYLFQIKIIPISKFFPTGKTKIVMGKLSQEEINLITSGRKEFKVKIKNKYYHGIMYERSVPNKVEVYLERNRTWNNSAPHNILKI